MAIKVLILDDEPEILESLRRLLELDPRLEIITTKDPEEALALITKEKIQIVLSDIVMPQMDGITFLKIVKAVNGLVQVIMMTAYSTVERVLACLEKGATDYLMKPFEVNEVKEVIENTIKRLERWRRLVIQARGLQDQDKKSSKEKEGLENVPDSETLLAKLENLVKEAPPDLTKRLLDWLEEEKVQIVRERLLSELGKALQRAPEASILRRMLVSKDPFIRNGAIEIGRHFGPEALPVLKELLNDPDKDVRKLVLDIAAFIPHEDSTWLFKKALDDPDPNIRMTAVEYLGERGEDDVVHVLEERLFQEKEPMLVATIFETLANIGKSPQKERIIKYFQENLDPILTHSFLKYLGTFGGIKELDWLEKNIKDQNIFFGREAVDALFKILKCNPEASLSDYLVETLKQAAKSERKAMAIYQILQTLYLARPDEAHRLAETWLEEISEEHRLAAESFLAELSSDKKE